MVCNNNPKHFKSLQQCKGFFFALNWTELLLQYHIENSASSHNNLNPFINKA
jgi:hypothetical protein